MRDTTERPEGIASGTCRLVGTNPEVILREAALLLKDRTEYESRSRLNNPYGDGGAAARIVGACLDFLGSSARVEREDASLNIRASHNRSPKRGEAMEAERGSAGAHNAIAL
jgi:hypothetical protein